MQTIRETQHTHEQHTPARQRSEHAYTFTEHVQRTRVIDKPPIFVSSRWMRINCSLVLCTSL